MFILLGATRGRSRPPGQGWFIAKVDFKQLFNDLIWGQQLANLSWPSLAEDGRHAQCLLMFFCWFCGPKMGCLIALLWPKDGWLTWQYDQHQNQWTPQVDSLGFWKLQSTIVEVVQSELLSCSHVQFWRVGRMLYRAGAILGFQLLVNKLKEFVGWQHPDALDRAHVATSAALQGHGVSRSTGFYN